MLNAELASQVIQGLSLVRAAERITVFSGAGLSMASGIPTYRDAGGLWTNSDNLRYSTGTAYREDPKGFHAFWDARKQMFRAAVPNPGHVALARLQQARPGTTLVTQNVDGLLEVAGAKGVLELHGSMRRLCCHHCQTTGQRGAWAMGRCSSCLRRARPDVVLFGEMLDEDTVTAAKLAASNCDVLIVVGTSAEVYPAAEIPQIALRYGAKLILVDPMPHSLSESATLVLRGQAEEILPLLVGDLGDDDSASD